MRRSRSCAYLLAFSSFVGAAQEKPARPWVFGTQQVDCTFWVASTGDDGSGGTDAEPWRTIRHAAQVAGAGDTVCVAPGSYDEAVTFTVSGAMEAPITFQSPGRDSTVREVEVAAGVSHLQLVGFRVVGFPDWGVTLLGDNQDIVLADLEVTGGETGIRFTVGSSGTPPLFGPVSDVAVENSVIRGSVFTAVDCTPGPCDRVAFRRLEIYGAGIGAGFAGDGLAVERGQDVVVEDCHIHDNGGDGIDLNSRDAGGTVPGIVVRRNRVLRSGRNGIKLWAGGRAVNNLIVDSADTALVTEGGTYEIVNNTIASATEYVYLVYFGDASTVSLFNNIFSNDEPAMGGTTVFFPASCRLTSDHNLFHNPFRESDVICADFVAPGACFSQAEINDGTWHARAGQGAHSRYADPQYLDPSGNDYHLTASSPAVDAGSRLEAPDLDLDGHPRDPQPDVGAFELRDGTPPAPPAAPTNLAASAISTTEIELSWQDNATDESEFRLEIRTADTGFREIGSVSANAIGTVVGDLAPFTAYTFRMRARNAGGNSAYSNEASATTLPADGENCVPDVTTLCLNHNRFKVEVDWTTSTGTGPGVPVPGGTGDSSTLWFFSPNNWEMLIKVLDGCGINDRYWVFFAATTEVGFTVTVTDTQENEVHVYTNPLGQAANAVTDTAAFATCP